MSKLSRLDTLNHLVDNASDYLYPSAIKECKQVVSSKAFRAIYAFAVLSLIVISFVMYMLSEIDVGKGGFNFFNIVLDIGVIIIIPVMLYQNMNSERSDGNFELTSITTITPMKILLGKWQSSMLQALLFSSLVMPGMIYSYFYNGVSVDAIFISFILTFYNGQFVCLVSLFFCSIGALKRSRMALMFITIVICIIICYSLVAMKIMMTRDDRFLKDLYDTQNLIVLMTSVILTIVFEGFLLSVAAARLSPYSANKSTLPRIFYFILIVLSCCEVLFFRYQGTFSARDIYVFLICFSIVNFVICFFFLLERNELNRKLYQKLQSYPVSIRWLVNIFYPGRNSAFIYFSLLFVLIFISFALIYPRFGSVGSGRYHMSVERTIAYLSLFYIYQLIIFIIFSIFTRTFPKIKVGLMGFLGLFILFILLFLPILFGVYFGMADEEIFIGLAFAYFSDNMGAYAMFVSILSGCFFIIATLVVVMSLGRRIENQRTYHLGERGTV